MAAPDINMSFRALSQKKTRTARLFTEADFKGVNYKEARLTRQQFEEYKKRFIGKPVPPQTVSDDALVALGYDMPEPWVQSCIEEPMPNWG